jgi:hypothetical protein
MGFLVFSLALVSSRVLGGDSPASVPREKERAPFASSTALTEKSTREPNPPAVAVTSSRGEESDTANARSNLRRVIRESFRYDPNARPKSSGQFSPALVAPQNAVDPETVVMAKLEVRSRPIDHGLSEAIAKYRDPRPQNNRKFGTGVIEKDFGKVRMSAATILYIPIAIGISW